MTTSALKEEELDRLAWRCARSSMMGVAALFVYYNAKYGWLTPPEYRRVSGMWLEPFMPVMKPYLPQLVLALGVGSLMVAAYCGLRYLWVSRKG
jgi:hypothetical protein